MAVTTSGTGNGTLTPQDNGTATYNAPDTAKDITLTLQVLNGPSKDRGPTFNISIVEPSGAYIYKNSGIRHINNTWSAGFPGVIVLTPSDVSFFNLLFYEGAAAVHAEGWMIGWPALEDHQQGIMVRVNSHNEVHTTDKIFTGVRSGPYAAGLWYWDIPWHFVTNSGRDVWFMTARELATSDANGTAVISKGGTSVSRCPLILLPIIRS